MAVFNLSITYPDDAQPRIIAALKARYTSVDSTGAITVPTAAQAIEFFRQEVMNLLKDAVYSYEYKQAVTAAGVTVQVVATT